jgi:hypothetical protein
MTTGRGRRTVVTMKIISAAGISAACAVAFMAASASAQPKSTTLKLVQHDSHFQFIDVAPKGGTRKPPSEGDEFVVGGALTEAGKPAGTSNLVCTVTQPGAKGLSECVGTLILKSGTIEFSGPSLLASSGDTFAISGGTGKYAAIAGLIVGTTNKNDTTDISVEGR